MIRHCADVTYSFYITGGYSLGGSSQKAVDSKFPGNQHYQQQIGQAIKSQFTSICSCLLLPWENLIWALLFRMGLLNSPPDISYVNRNAIQQINSNIFKNIKKMILQLHIYVSIIIRWSILEFQTFYPSNEIPPTIFFYWRSTLNRYCINRH